MDIVLTFLLSICAFLLGACPFAVWIGRYLMSKDIRNFGDGNPGTANVFKAGSIRWGILALILEIAKGFPFVFLAFSYFKLPIIAVIIVALCAICGHAFSPILRFKGGKALAVTGGVILAISPTFIFLIIIAFLFLFFLFIEQDAWSVVFSFICTSVTIGVLHGFNWEMILVVSILIVLIIKHLNDLREMPRFRIKFLKWLHIGKTSSQH